MMVTKTKPQRTKVPPRTVYADDLSVAGEDGESYYPHAGEWVRVRGRMSVNDYIKTLAIRNLRVSDSADEEIDDLFDWLAGRIIEWNFTDENGEPMPEPSASVIRDLDFAEIIWLLSAIVPPVKTEEETKNGDSPSI